MKGTNPIIPTGMNFEGAKRGRLNMRMAVIVVVLLHIALFTGILFNACKQKEEESNEGALKTDGEKMVQTTSQQPEPAPLPQPPLLTEPSLPGLPDSSGLPPLPATVGPTHPAAPAPVLPSTSLGLPSVPSAPPLIAETSREHIVASGENFWTIGKKYDVSAKSIEGANPTVIPTRMKIGQKITIPAKPVADPLPGPTVVNDGSTYTVKSGDTLGHIAQRHKVKLNDLKSANPNVVPTRMRIGQQLKIPTGAPTSPSSVAPSLSVLPDATTSPPVDPITGLPLLPAANR